ncbi:MAG: hypothetical protein HZA52_03835 [Planctomycetes bacterium]|nr:hypothetical protein [Planctomycetota bacterium]
MVALSWIAALLATFLAVQPARVPEPRPLAVAQEATIWRELAAIGALDPASRDRTTRITALRVSSPGRDATAIGALVRAKLDALSGAPARLAWELSGSWPYDREASWVAAEVLPNGPLRSRAIVAALGTLEDAARESALTAAQAALAYEVWVAAADALRIDEALSIGRNLHARSHATWSAISLALTTMRAGLADECDAVLAAQLAITPRENSGDLAALWDHRGIASLGAGWEQPGRFALGRAVLHGSTDGAVVLARLDLAAGEFERARAGFRAALIENPASDWARRGWGLSLLPPKAGSNEPEATSW